MHQKHPPAKMAFAALAGTAGEADAILACAFAFGGAGTAPQPMSDKQSAAAGRYGINLWVMFFLTRGASTWFHIGWQKAPLKKKGRSLRHAPIQFGKLKEA
jgi:hypothetical protein